jgi:sulfite reductase (ferredoxin)
MSENPTHEQPVTNGQAAAHVKKETKAQKSERLKLEKNPWDAFDEVRQFARDGRASVLPEWAEFYFKWWGIYTQGDGVGATGGVGGEGKASEYFMMRIGIGGGRLTSHQTRAIAEISRKFGRGLADVTTRQCIQLHWLTIEALPQIVDKLTEIGLSPKGACGDVVRNVTGCPLAGLEANEIVDASSLGLQIQSAMMGNTEFFNLPRKFKITATGCPVWCSYPEINDIAMTAVRRKVGGRDEVGFSMRVGGGLSRDPHLGVKLNAFLYEDQVIAAVRTATEIYREQLALRESRTHARMKFLFLTKHWTGERFLAEMEDRLHCRFDAAVEETPPLDIYRDHIGIHAQKQKGLAYVGATVLRGRLNADQLTAIADLSDRFAKGEVRTTIMQNILIPNVPTAKAQALAKELIDLGLQVEPSVFYRGAVACTGTEFCKLAITETKSFARWLVEEMEERLPGFDQPLKLHVTGCPNSCGQHWIADIGLEGKKQKHNGELRDAFQFNVGGAVGRYQKVSRSINYRCLSENVPAAIERMLRGYLHDRAEGEDLQAWFARKSDPELRALAEDVAANLEETTV